MSNKTNINGTEIMEEITNRADELLRSDFLDNYKKKMIATAIRKC